MKLLAERRADFRKLDNRNRSCLQLARNCQGENRVLATWILENVTGIEETYAKGRAQEENGRGSWSYEVRSLTGPDHKAWKGHSKGSSSPTG